MEANNFILAVFQTLFHFNCLMSRHATLQLTTRKKLKGIRTVVLMWIQTFPLNSSNLQAKWHLLSRFARHFDGVSC